MKVLHISYDFNSSSFVYKLANELGRYNVKSCIYTSKGVYYFDGDKFVGHRLKLVVLLKLCYIFDLLIQKISFAKHGFVSLSLISVAIDKKIINFDYDVIHVHWPWRGFCNIDSLCKLNKSIYFHLHDYCLLTGGMPLYSNAYDTNHLASNLLAIAQRRALRFLRKSNATLLCPSTIVRDIANKYVENKTFVFPSYLAAPRQAIINKYFNLRKREHVFLMVILGSDPVAKGLDLAVECFSKLPSGTRNNLQLIVLGYSGVELKKPSDLLISYYPVVPFEQVEFFYKSVDFTVVYSKSETFSQVGAESLVFGTPVISSMHLPIKNYVPSHHLDLITEKWCADALRDIVAMAIAKKAYYKNDCKYIAETCPHVLDIYA